MHGTEIFERSPSTSCINTTWQPARPTALATTGAGLRFSYTYDPQGNTTAVTDAAGVHAYRYDSLNRLTAASGSFDR